ncbi:threonine/serine ThrE exporter family protein [Ornithinimicrobium cryptoxanthini]|uniref:Threonine/serine exporter family protein n=1 Tax=Ornithinimicrobium cryptoxanthini TaxID=2934161 RepID=A0ABY4YK49_9MICO|nr:threonine/serine exporter family protein [Ornithinimicrobium cryptoxanthini]USQ77124.1 threonine/serine exporter family protein [Ornithinimicrobium cryptoxanthini]
MSDDPSHPDVPLGDVTGPQVIPGREVRGVPRVGRAWRVRAEMAVRGVGPPTVAIGVPGSDDAVSQRHARAVIDLALRVGEAMLSTGASASEVVATVLRLCSAYGINSVHVDITFTSITVAIHRGLDEDPLSLMRVVRVRTLDYTRLQHLQVLVDQIAQPGPGAAAPEPEEARLRLTSILSAPHPYRRWLVSWGGALLAVGVVALFGAGPVMWAIAAATALVVDQTQRWLSRIGVAAFFNQAVSAAIPTSVAVLIFWMRSRGWELPGVDSPSLVVISGIILLLAGLTVMGAAQDAIDGYYVTAGARGLEMFMLTLGLAVGVATVLGLAWRLGVPMEISPYVSVGGNPVQSTLAAAAIGAGFAWSTYTGFRATLLAAAIAAGSWGVYELVFPLGLGVGGSVVLPAAVVGAVAYAAHRTLRVPELAIVMAGIVPLLPGLSVYRAIFLMMDDTVLLPAAAEALFNALSIGVGLAAGVWAGQYLARRRFGLDLAAQRARNRSRGALR